VTASEEAMSGQNDQVRTQLKRILGSKQFRSSELQQQFLSFVVEKTLNGSGDEIKEYVIGAEAFGRGEGFDPRLDSVVRVVARRVRDRLTEYYRTDGKDDPMVIVLEKGSYVPSFQPRREIDASEPIMQPEEASAAVPGAEGEKPQTLAGAAWPRVGLGWRVAGSVFLLTGLMLAVYLFVRPAAPPRISKYTQLTDDGQGKLGAFAVGTPAPLLTDGSRVYFSEVSGSQIVISQVSTSGGQTVSLRTDLKTPQVVMDISPDRSKLLATEFFRPSPDRQLQVLPLPGGEPHRLGDLTGHDGAWSPDGSRICYAKGNALYLARSDGSDSRLLAELPGEASWPRWSPDGSKLRFTLQDANANTSLWEAPASGSNPHPLLSGWNDHPAECCGNWSPDGKYFVFQSTRQGSTGLWAIREGRRLFGRSSPVPSKLTEGPVSVWAPVFSRDGRQIFAVVQQRRGELVRYDASQQAFRSYLGGISADHVEFSRDSQWVAYSAYPEQTIWKSRPDGRERLQLSASPMAAIFPRWSPDGSRIAFMGSLPGKAVRIYIVSTNGGVPELMMPGDSPQIDPNWSPDGNSLMFAALPAETDVNNGQPVIQIFDLRSRQLSTLPGSIGLTAPRWSPDGRFVVATALSQGKWSDPAVRIYDFKTGSWSALEKDPIDNKWWSADGQYFYFDKLLTNDPAIYRIRLSDRQIERITSLKNVRRAFNEMGWWMGLTPDGSPMALRDASIEEIYALDFSGR
jgi:Tol biopolymer transport system component